MQILHHAGAERCAELRQEREKVQLPQQGDQNLQNRSDLILREHCTLQTQSQRRSSTLPATESLHVELEDAFRLNAASAGVWPGCLGTLLGGPTGVCRTDTY